MKTQIRKLAIATGLSALMGTAVLLGATWDLNGYAKVPFGFQVENRVMPAGNYFVTRANPLSFAYDSNALLIKNMDTGETMTALAPISKYHNHGDGKMVFKQYGNQYFLTQVCFQSESVGHGLTQTRVEKELAQSGSGPVLASVRLK